VAHEIRNPLVSIGGFARRLQQKRPDLAEGEIILKESKRLEGILDRIQAYLRPVEIRPRTCAVNDVIRTSVEVLLHDFEGDRTDCVLELDEAVSTVETDPDVLGDVVSSLARNAIEAMDWGETFAIRSTESDRNVQVVLKGRIPRTRFKDLEALLLPFEEGGISHGLPLCYKLLRDMGGFLNCDREGEEILFTVSLPKGEPSGDLAEDRGSGADPGTPAPAV
jgi:signal transduction histidine kinase